MCPPNACRSAPQRYHTGSEVTPCIGDNVTTGQRAAGRSRNLSPNRPESERCRPLRLPPLEAGRGATVKILVDHTLNAMGIEVPETGSVGGPEFHYTTNFAPSIARRGHADERVGRVPPCQSWGAAIDMSDRISDRDRLSATFFRKPRGLAKTEAATSHDAIIVD